MCVYNELNNKNFSDTEFYNHMKFSAYVGLFARVIIVCFIMKKIKELIW